MWAWILLFKIFTPLVFGTNGGMGEECSLFLKKLAEKLSYKTDESYANIVTWLRTKISFSILKSVNMCIRGSRRPFKSTQETEEVGDFRFNATIAGLWSILSHKFKIVWLLSIVIRLGTGHLSKSTGAGIDSGTMKFFRFIWVGHEISSVYLGGSWKFPDLFGWVMKLPAFIWVGHEIL